MVNSFGSDTYSPSLPNIGVGSSSGGPTPKLPPPSGPGTYGGPAPTGSGEPVVSSHASRGLHTGPGATTLPGPPGHPTTGPGVGPAAPSASGNQTFPDDLDIHSVPPEHKKEGTDWFAIFNPKATRQLEVSLVHTLMHERWTILHFVAE